MINGKTYCVSFVINPDDFEKCKPIIIEYLQILAIDLDYMNLPSEFATIDKKYGANEGALILALDGNEAIGCVGVRKIVPGIAELKRLYVRDSHRGLKVGVTLLEKALESARNLGYSYYQSLNKHCRDEALTDGKCYLVA